MQKSSSFLPIPKFVGERELKLVTEAAQVYGGKYHLRITGKRRPKIGGALYTHMFIFPSRDKAREFTYLIKSVNVGVKKTRVYALPKNVKGYEKFTTSGKA